MSSPLVFFFFFSICALVYLSSGLFQFLGIGYTQFGRVWEVVEKVSNMGFGEEKLDFYKWEYGGREYMDISKFMESKKVFRNVQFY